MPEIEEAAEAKETTETTKANGSPLVFISHDSRDAELAEAFSKLLKAVSAGMIKSFRSSDKKGTEGIEFGDEWYKRLMLKLEDSSDVVCLLTERSLERPWILYEAGVAKGKMNTPVHGVALGVPLARVSTGPFYQFQNCDDDEGALSKLVLQLCRRTPELDPDEEVVKSQVRIFKNKVDDVTKSYNQPKTEDTETPIESSAVAKLLEEMKIMVREIPRQVQKRTAIGGPPARSDYLLRRRFDKDFFYSSKLFRIDSYAAIKSTDTLVSILVISSLFRNDYPWIYELGLEVYRTFKTGTEKEVRKSLYTLRKVIEYTQLNIKSKILLDKDEDKFKMFYQLIDRYMEGDYGIEVSRTKRPLFSNSASNNDEDN